MLSSLVTFNKLFKAITLSFNGLADTEVELTPENGLFYEHLRPREDNIKYTFIVSFKAISVYLLDTVNLI